MFASLMQSAINRVLRLDPEAGAALSSLEGKTIALELSAVSDTFYLRVEPHGVSVTVAAPQVGTEPCAPDITIAGAPLALLGLLRGDGEPDTLAARGVSVSGDAAAMRELKRALSSLHIDWEEQLAKWIGDTPARGVTRAATGLGGWVQIRGEMLARDVGEYLREEARLAPSGVELETYSGDVDALRDDVERLVKRIERLERRHTGQST